MRAPVNRILPVMIMLLAALYICPANSLGADNTKSDGIPTWARITFWGSFGLLLGKALIFDFRG